MRMTNLFSQTLREAPADAEAMSHILLLRAGFIRQLGSGIFSYLPLAKRTLDKIEGIIRAEMDSIGGQEIKMPVVHVLVMLVIRIMMVYVTVMIHAQMMQKMMQMVMEYVVI
mgnify:CR=1 FL=1